MWGNVVVLKRGLGEVFYLPSPTPNSIHRNVAALRLSLCRGDSPGFFSNRAREGADMRGVLHTEPTTWPHFRTRHLTGSRA